MSTSALALHNVVKRYGHMKALAGLDLDVPEGSIFGLVGSNGAGKTTCMAVAAGLLGIAGGVIDILGGGPFSPSRHTGRVTLLPQDSRFPPHARVAELLTFYARLQGLAEADIGPGVAELLEWVHLADRQKAPVRTLSHGMARRLAIAQAFVGKPELVLLDEPLNGLDPREAARMRDMIRQRRGKQTIVISSHILSDIEALCDTVAFIEHGRRVRQDALDAIVHRSHRLTYLISRGPPPWDALRQAAPEVEWSTNAEETEITAAFPDLYTTEALNARALAALLDAKVGILEIRRGSDLESEYLNSSRIQATRP